MKGGGNFESSKVNTRALHKTKDAVPEKSKAVAGGLKGCTTGPLPAAGRFSELCAPHFPKWIVPSMHSSPQRKVPGDGTANLPT